MLESLYWFQMVTIFVTNFHGFGTTSYVSTSKMDSGISVARMSGMNVSGQYIEVPLWQAVYYFECNKKKYVALADLPTEEQANAISRYIEETDHQPYGDNSNELVVNKNLEVVAFKYETSEGVKKGMEDWGEPQ